MSVITGIIIVVLCILLEGFFAGSEIGIISCNRIRISSLFDKGDKRARIVMSFLENPEKFLSTALVGVNLAVITSSSITTALVSRYARTPGEAAAIATMVILPLVLVFGETIPKIIYRQYADRLSLISAYPLRAASVILFPFVFIATKISALISKIFVRGSALKNPYVTREEIRLLMLEASKEGVLDKSEIAMTSEIFDFGRTDVQSVMVPLSKVVAASYSSSVRDLAALVSKSGFSRIPIYKERKDNIIGTIEMSDLVSADIEAEDAAGLIREPYKVKWSTSIDDVLKDFQYNRKNIAIIIDKSQKAAGIATLEDIVEEIVGEIEDEYDIKR